MKKILGYFVAILALASCATPKEITYFQDMEDGTVAKIMDQGLIRIQPDDRLAIFVKTRNEDLTQLFNISGAAGGQVNTQYSVGYNVDSNGNIVFPELGEIHVAGLSREEIASYIKNELEKRNLVKEPLVTVLYRNMYYNMLGEVRNAGRKEIDKDRITIIDAISEAGGLTINGVRTNVLVMRKENDEIKGYRVNLTNMQELVKSPVYQIKQDDVIYVESNMKAQRESTVNGNNTMTVSFWMSLASFFMGIVNFLK